MGSVGRIATNVGKLLFDSNYATIVEETIKKSSKAYKDSGQSIFKNFGTQVKDGFIKAENATKGTTFWQGLKDSAVSLPDDMCKAWKAEKGFFKSLKSSAGQLGKRLPLIGSVLMVACELPNIFKATKNEGLGSGLLETGKTTARLTGGAAAAAIGQAICPIPLVGGLLGWIAGDWLVSKVVGKSYSEKQYEAQEKLAEAEAIAKAQQQQLMAAAQNPAFTSTTNPYMYGAGTVNPASIQAMRNMLYGAGTMNDDFMFNASGLNALV